MDLVGFAGDHAGEVRGLVDEIVEHSEIRLRRPEGRAHEISDFREVGRDAASRALDSKGLADDEVAAFGRELAHHPLIIGVRGVLRPFIGDLAAIFGGVQRFMNAGHPLLLNRHGVDRRDLDRAGLLRESRTARRQRDSETASQTEHPAAINVSDPTGHFPVIHWIVLLNVERSHKQGAAEPFAGSILAWRDHLYKREALLRSWAKCLKTIQFAGR